MFEFPVNDQHGVIVGRSRPLAATRRQTCDVCAKFLLNSPEVRSGPAGYELLVTQSYLSRLKIIIVFCFKFARTKKIEVSCQKHNGEKREFVCHRCNELVCGYCLALEHWHQEY